MRTWLLIVLLSLTWPGPVGGSTFENFRFASSLPTFRLGPSHSRGHGRPRFSKALPSTSPVEDQDPDLKGKVIGEAANDYARFILSDENEIAWSRDGKSWTVVDFNEMYRGYYGAVHFVGIAAGAGDVAVVGTYVESGAPAMFISQRGNVWSERVLTYSQGEDLFELGEAPLAIRADLERDEYVLTCTDGVLFFVPSCSHCNRLEYHGSD